MKKIYEAPTLVGAGNLVHETKNGGKIADLETVFTKPSSAGCLGFYL